MRVNLQLRAAESLRLPVHYNSILQGFIYRNLGAAVAERVHDMGWADGKRHLRLFTFSRLQGRFVRQGDYLNFFGPLSILVASPVEDILESFALNLVKARTVRLGESEVELVSVEVTMPDRYRRPVLLKALSPITAYSTLQTPDGRKKTYYYAPQEPEFGRQVLENLRRKIRTWSGEDIPIDGMNFRPVRVSNRNLVVARYKGTIIKGWTGIYELDAPEPYFRMALDAGLGAKNSQGFGFVEVWTPRRRTSHGDTEDTKE